MIKLKLKFICFWLVKTLFVLFHLTGLYSSKVLGDPAPLIQNDLSNSKLVITNTQAHNEGSFKSFANEVIKLSAHISIYSAELFASDAAEKELNKFRTGEHQGLPAIFSAGSIGSKELFEGKYYQQLTHHLVEELAKWYQGKIPDSGGLFSQANSFRVFSPGDALWEVTDGIDMADIIGTFTYYVRASTNNGIIYFQGVNKISLESYSGENYLGHGLVNNPRLGPLSSTAQVFNWQVAIPEKYRK